MSSRLNARSTKLFALILILSLVLLPSTRTVAQQYRSSAADEVIVTPGNPIEIAVAFFSGWPTYQDIIFAAEMALDDYGQIRGFDLQKNDHDAGCDDTSGQNEANIIVANVQNVGVIGPFCSISTIGAAPVFEANGVVMISASNTRPDLAPFGINIFNRVVIEDPDYYLWDQNIRTYQSVQDWEAEFDSRYGRYPDEFGKYTYDATTLLLSRIEKASRLVGSDLHIDRSDLAEAVRNTASFSGVTGQIAIKVNGDRLNLYDNQLVIDSFSSATLDPAWSWLDEDATHWSLTARPGFLRITTQEESKNQLLRRIPAANFALRTYLEFKPVENFQFAGLRVFLDGDNHLTFGRAYCDLAPPICVGNGLYFDHIEAGAPVGSNFATIPDVAGKVYLRLVREGGEYTASYSTNGTQWTEVGTHVIGFTPDQVGLVAHNNGQPVSEIPADFDYFVVAAKYLEIFLPFIN